MATHVFALQLRYHLPLRFYARPGSGRQVPAQRGSRRHRADALYLLEIRPAAASEGRVLAENSEIKPDQLRTIRFAHTARFSRSPLDDIVGLEEGVSSSPQPSDRARGDDLAG